MILLWAVHTGPNDRDRARAASLGGGERRSFQQLFEGLRGRETPLYGVCGYAANSICGIKNVLSRLSCEQSKRLRGVARRNGKVAKSIVSGAKRRGTQVKREEREEDR